MITSVMFRHGIESPQARERIHHRLSGLHRRDELIRRVEVVLDRVAFSGSPACNYLCHISLRGMNKRALDIYADKRWAEMAIDDAFDRLYMELKSGYPKRIRKRR